MRWNGESYLADIMRQLNWGYTEQILVVSAVFGLLFEFLGNSLTQTDQPNQTKQKFIKLYHLDFCTFIERLFNHQIVLFLSNHPNNTIC